MHNDSSNTHLGDDHPSSDRSTVFHYDIYTSVETYGVGCQLKHTFLGSINSYMKNELRLA